MCILELFYDIERVDSSEDLEDKIFRFWSADPDGRLILLRVKEGIDTYDIEAQFTEEIYDHDYVPYDKLSLFLDVELEVRGEIEDWESSYRNAFITTRGTCQRDCCDKGKSFDGYALRDLPPCKDKVIGYSVWAAKYSNLQDVITDIANWINICSSLDVYIHIFDYTIGVDWNSNFACSWLGFHIQGKKLTIYTDQGEMRKMFEKYNKGYPVHDELFEEVLQEAEKEEEERRAWRR